MKERNGGGKGKRKRRKRMRQTDQQRETYKKKARKQTPVLTTEKHPKNRTFPRQL